jgi:hypothetical protein
MSDEAPKKKKYKSHKEINEDIVRGLAGIMCTYKEMSEVLGCSVDTLERHFADTIKEAQSNGRQSLRRFQYKAAEKGNSALLIWLGKQWLGQSDKSEVVNKTFEILDEETKAKLAQAYLEAEKGEQTSVN